MQSFVASTSLRDLRGARPYFIEAGIRQEHDNATGGPLHRADGVVTDLGPQARRSRERVPASIMDDVLAMVATLFE